MVAKGGRKGSVIYSRDYIQHRQALCKIKIRQIYTPCTLTHIHRQTLKLNLKVGVEELIHAECVRVL